MILCCCVCVCAAVLKQDRLYSYLHAWHSSRPRSYLPLPSRRRPGTVVMQFARGDLVNLMSHAPKVPPVGQLGCPVLGRLPPLLGAGLHS